MSRRRVLVLNYAGENGLLTNKRLQGSDMEMIDGNPEYGDLIADDYDIIVVNGNGHKPTALTVCAKLRQQVTAPLVLVTTQAGVDECIVQPVSEELLHAKLTRWLRWATPKEIAPRE